MWWLLRRLTSPLLAVPSVVGWLVWRGPTYSVPALVVASLAYLITGRRYRWIYIIYKTLPRDVRIAWRFLHVGFQLRKWEKHQMSVHTAFDERARQHPFKTAFYFEGAEWSFSRVAAYSYRVSAFFHQQGFVRGDVVALVSTNRPEYVAIWLGLARLGVVAALVNSNLRRGPLLHSLRSAIPSCRAIVIEAGELAQAISEIQDDLQDMSKFVLGGNNTTEPLQGAINLDDGMKGCSPVPNPALEVKVGTQDKLLYIYTSGTTGLPKAAVITNQRFMFMATGVYIMLAVRPDDVLYTPLPLYHTAGGVIGVGHTILYGVSMALRRKFSVSNFWLDCVQYKCTVAQYIGEICRYLLSAPSRPEERQHSVRLMFGNGLRPQIWPQFVKRFGIANIGEFYGATEGNSNLVNIDNTVGTVGFVPRFAGSVFPVGIIRVDEDTEEPLRGPDGLCIRCKPGESGVFVGKIKTKNAISSFHGYADKKASEKKIIQNVFSHGDAVFNSGDILVMDELGYYYFKDRTGDTFRWKGENVATSEVEAVVSNVLGLSDAVVYGVEVPGAEGRAGMAAIVGDATNLNLEELAAGIKASLPSYARPIFVRVLKELPMTGTFKLKKRDLQMEGFNPTLIKDPLFFMDTITGKFVPITEDLYKNFMDKKVKV